MVNSIMYMDSECIARIIDDVASAEDSVAAVQIAGNKSLREIFLVTTKALYLNSNRYCYGK